MKSAKNVDKSNLSDYCESYFLDVLSSSILHLVQLPLCSLSRLVELNYDSHKTQFEFIYMSKYLHLERQTYEMCIIDNFAKQT